MCQPLGNQAVLIREIYRCIQQCSSKFGPTQIRTTKFQHTTLISGADQNATCSSHTQPKNKKKHYLHICRDSLHLYSLVLFNQLQEISSNICSLNQLKSLDSSPHWFITSWISLCEGQKWGPQTPIVWPIQPIQLYNILSVVCWDFLPLNIPRSSPCVHRNRAIII